ncbi:putative nicotinamide synthase cyclopropane fatty acid synthase protein [Xanthomonas albilineans]|nr:putative nicotinamide synthase cyclopropane fatty acid synthase protein [Xanthomonas albilineans]
MLRTQPERILFIGSGPLPLSAIWFSRILDVHVDGIDISKSAVEESSTLIKVLGLDRSIRIIHRNAVDYDVSNYDMIVIALLAKPKQLLLDNIARTARSDCTIVCRTSFGLRSLIYEPTFFSSAILDNFDIEDIRLVKGASDDTVSSLKLSIRNL